MVLQTGGRHTLWGRPLAMKQDFDFHIVWFLLLCVYTAFCIFLPRPAQPAFAEMRSDPVLVIDAGHGGEDGGAVTASGVREADLNLAVAKRADDLASLLGIRTRMIRDSDVSVYSDGSKSIAEKKSSDLRNRVKIANSFDDAILLSIHQNHFSESKYSGAQVFYAATDGSKALAETIQDSLLETLDPRNHRQAKRCSGVYLMEHVRHPAVLVECGFLSNVREAELLQDETYQKNLALAMICPIADVGKAVTAHEI